MSNWISVKDKLLEQTAYALAQLPEELQTRIAAIKPDVTGGTAEGILRKHEEGWRWEPDLKCPDGKACKRGDSFLRHDLECWTSEMCGGKTCCLECPCAKQSCYPCDRMCSKAQAMRKEKRDEEKAAADRRAEKQVEQYQKETQATARRILLAAEAAGLPDKEFVNWGYEGATVEKLREYAGGVFPEGERWYEAKFSVRRLSDPVKTARQLGCSTDYLLGLTDDPTPAAVPEQEDGVPVEIRPVWLPGAPKKSGSVAAQFVIPGDPHVMVSLCWYDNDTGKCRFSAQGAYIDAECTGWWPVPEKEDTHADDQ